MTSGYRNIATMNPLVTCLVSDNLAVIFIFYTDFSKGKNRVDKFTPDDSLIKMHYL